MTFFVSITEHFDPYFQLNLLPNVFPNELFVSEKEILSDLSKLATNKTIRPDGISHKLLKEFALEFSPIIKDIYNQSFVGRVPTWLLENVNYYTGFKDLSPSRYQVRPQTYGVNQLLS